jgi:hypothetical protein
LVPANTRNPDDGEHDPRAKKSASPSDLHSSAPRVMENCSARPSVFTQPGPVEGRPLNSHAQAPRLRSLRYFTSRVSGQPLIKSALKAAHHCDAPPRAAMANGVRSRSSACWSVLTLSSTAAQARQVERPHRALSISTKGTRR